MAVLHKDIHLKDIRLKGMGHLKAACNISNRSKLL